jgi:hypothetical protein
MRQGALPGAPDDRIAAFAREISDFDRTLQGATTAMDEAGVRIRAIKSALMRSTVGDASLDDQARTLERRLADLRFHMTGDTLRDEFNEPGPLSLADRFRAISRSAGTTYGPTPNQLASFDVVKEQFAALRRDFDQLVGADLPALEAKLGPAGVPWTPGRGAQ